MMLNENQLAEVLKGKKTIEYSKSLAEHNSKELRAYVDQMIEMQIGTDAGVIWAMGGKIYLEEIPTSDGKIGYSIAFVVIYPGYNAERHLYSLDGKIFTEDDYDWNDITDASQEMQVSELAEDSSALPTFSFLQGSAHDMGYIFPANLFKENLKDAAVDYRLLVVNKLNLDNPILKIEKAYLNMLSDIKTQPTCGWVVLMHGGHFYIPVESVEDPVNHEELYYIKIFNSYPTIANSTRALANVSVELFDQIYTFGIRYRSGYCVNWRKLFFSQFLSEDYLSNIPDLYSVTDKPYDKPKRRTFNHDGIRFELDEDSIEEDEGDEDDEKGNDIPEI